MDIPLDMLGKGSLEVSGRSDDNVVSWDVNRILVGEQVGYGLS